MSYLDKNLTLNERIIYSAKYPWITYLAAWSSLLFLGILIVGIIWFVQIMILVTTTEIAVTNQRVIKKTGLFSRTVRELELGAIEEVHVSQGFWGRIFKFGTVTVHGTGIDNLETPTIASPNLFANSINEAVHATGQKLRKLTL